MKRNKKISISTCFDYEIPLHQQIPLIAESGFTHVSIGEKEEHSKLKDPTERRNFKELITSSSLDIDTLHGPRLDKPNIMKEIEEKCRAAMFLDVPIIVVHGSPFDFSQDEYNKRLVKLIQICSQLEKVSNEYSVKFALENVMPGPGTELVKSALIQTNSPSIGFCYDSSHDQIEGPKKFDLLDDLRDFLIAIHLSDRIREFVDHVLPWEGFIDWEKLCSLIGKTKYTNPVTMEVMITNSKVKDTKEFLKLTYERGCRLHDKIFSS